ncbi:ribonuclease R [Lewinellaceae bacterium SD302]|nr:ribonuclease R [Lewinellaceae bacterium SD302]
MPKKKKIKGSKLSARELSRAIFKHLKTNYRKQYNPKQLVRKLKVTNSPDAVQHAIDELVKKKKLVATDNYKYKYNQEEAAKNSKNYLEGRVDMTRNGSAFIVVENREDDIFVPAQRLNTALDGDRVKIRTWQSRGRRKPEGEVVEVLTRSVDHFVGTLHIFNKIAVVSADGQIDMDIVVDRENLMGGRNREKVVVSVTDWTPDRNGALGGHITAVLGKPGSSNIEMQAILINNGFNIAFPEQVIIESEALPDRIGKEEIAKRRDMREVTTFTIDPLTAKDFDDALSIQHLENGRVEIGVHIADVSHYVRPNSALDQEAQRRSTSVYLVDRVCPMLPEKISNELCSLRPNEDKLSFSAVFEFDPKTWNVEKRWFGRTVIHSDRRFTYEEAQEVLDTGKGDYKDELFEMQKIAAKLRERRYKDGAINFASNEVRFKLDEDGKPVEVYVKKQIETNRLIEDFMLLANREVATYIVKKEERLHTRIPFVYRIHDEPDPDKVAELAKFAAALGVEMDLKNPKAIAASYNKLMSIAEKDPAVKMLSPIAIRTMAKAIYTTENIGHYGLGFENYTHFTSPIRRYADVLVHRVLEANLNRKEAVKYNAAKLEEDCKHISNQERKAVTAERESIKYKQVEYIQDHIGEEFDSIINGIADFGVFVELSENYVEGMISFQNMDESYNLADNKLSMTGGRSGKQLKMGDAIRVRILDADLKKRRIEMALVEVLETTKVPDDKKPDEPVKHGRGRSQSSRTKGTGSGGRRTTKAKSNGSAKSTTTTRKRTTKSNTTSKNSGSGRGRKPKA